MSFFSPPPSSRLLTGLCAVYAMLLLTIIVLIVALRSPGQSEPDRTLEKQLGNLSAMINAQVERLSQDGGKFMEKLNHINTSVQIIINDKSKDQMKSGLEDVMVALGKLSDRVKKLLLNGTSEITCPDGWLYYSLSCYFISKVGKSWEESTKICKDKNSHLVVVNSEEEQILGSWPARRVLRARSWRRRGLRPYLPPRRLE
ncbi:Hypothetical predicted protein [Pelobates cultripes]|uniref:Uncharacterized protein n=1 Tax=Pelobates cultripes TaxID=61616 RepID=A0AAD1VUU5_PELCU|nr:Hypothetical predicted protein [Pelobates cultripes]